MIYCLGNKDQKKVFTCSVPVPVFKHLWFTVRYGTYRYEGMTVYVEIRNRVPEQKPRFKFGSGVYCHFVTQVPHSFWKKIWEKKTIKLIEIHKITKLKSKAYPWRVKLNRKILIFPDSVNLLQSHLEPSTCLSCTKVWSYLVIWKNSRKYEELEVFY